jgi:hypothetical protein
MVKGKRKESSFFEKKNQKTFSPSSAFRSNRPRYLREQKFFVSFFKKEMLPCFAVPAANVRQMARGAGRTT